ncbi:MAG TPA: hydrogenase maturation protease [Thermoplasmata archaeon]|nr:hydrogenase maturation protease [Thermoplasmata archaeon]
MDLCRPLVIGVGNRHRHDDAIGLEAVDRVRERLGDRVRALPYDGESTGLLDLWAGVSLVVLVDALRSHGAPGRIHRFEGDLAPLLAEPATTSTHGLSVGEVWRLGRSLGQVPDRLVVLGVEGEDFSPGIGLSPPVARSLGPLTGAIVAELAADPSLAGEPAPRGAADA